MSSDPGPPRLPRFSIALVSAAALAYEVLLMRLFSIAQWHHFAYMIISLALLGYGASGTFLHFFQDRLQRRFTAALVTNLSLCGVACVVCYAAAQHIPFHAEELLWDWRQWPRLTAVYLLLALPFLFAANAIALAFGRFRSQIGRVYAFDLLGAGAGSLGIVLLLFLVLPDAAVRMVASVAVFAALLACRELRPTPWGVVMIPAAAAILLVSFPGRWLEPALSPYKGLSELLRISGTRVVAERGSPLGVVTAVESPVVPLRHAPGLSLEAANEPPPQIALFTDGDGMSAVNRDRGQTADSAYLDQTTSALAFHLGTRDRVLVLGAGGGSEVLQALAHGAREVEAVELNADIVALVREDFGAFAGRLYDRPEVRVHVAEARGFLAGFPRSYDLIQIALLDSFASAAAGLHALSESYLYTTEALALYHSRLSPGGVLSITRWVRLPPRDMLKLFATAQDALRANGVAEPERHLAMIRGWQTATLLVKNEPFDAAELEALRNFSRARAFDTAYYPGIPEVESNRFNLLPEPYYYRGALSLLGPERPAFLDQYKFDLRPATDDRPYFFHFFRWKALPEILALKGAGGLSFLEWGYLVLVATLLQAAVISALLILLPMVWRARERGSPAAGRRTFPYFFAIGLAFLFLEIALIQKFILYLHHPVYAVATVLASFLVFAGLGSAWVSGRSDRNRRTTAVAAVAGIAGLGLMYLLLLEPFLAQLLALPVAVKFAITTMVIAPLAFCMGMPFPLALSELGAIAPRTIPWAWAVNGCASVISPVLATLLAIEFGFKTVVLSALLLYAIAAWRFPAGGPAKGSPDEHETSSAEPTVRIHSRPC